MRKLRDYCGRSDQDDTNEILVTGGLQYIKGDNGKGRTITADVPRFSLLSGDVLSPSPAFLDIGGLESANLPLQIKIWRQLFDIHGKQIGLARHRNPSFSRHRHKSYPNYCHRHTALSLLWNHDRCAVSNTVAGHVAQPMGSSWGEAAPARDCSSKIKTSPP